MTERKTKDFNRAAATWDANPRRVALARAVAASIARELPLSRTTEAMEFGCGTGLVTFELAQKLGHVTAVDGAAGMLNELEKKASEAGVANVTAVRVDPDRTVLPEGPFDLVFSSMVLHHVPDTAALLALFFGALRPGGRLALADLDEEDGTFHDDPTGVAHHGFSRSRLGELLEEAGFADMRFATAHSIEKSRDEGCVSYPVFLATARKP